MGTGEIIFTLKKFFFPIKENHGTDNFQNKVLIDVNLCENLCSETNIYVTAIKEINI
jgi:hypothetical protein